MDTFKVLFDASRPDSLGGRLRLSFGVGAAGLLAFTLVYSTYTNYIEEPYRLTVCWNHHKQFQLARLLPGVHPPRTLLARFNAYNDCISAARSGGEIPPLV
jgi:hypothetical protein